MARADAAPASIVAPAKNHYVILDGLRGVAALMVLLMHLFEGHTGGDLHKMIINHGYLAVDFFFLLSGFVVAYAYDDRWGGVTQWEFYKRRLVRLQPMVILGSIIGAALFVFQIDPFYPLAAGASLWQVLLLMVIGFTLIPVPPSLDVRGWGETFPLNGPAWSLFFEYCANILYAAGLYRLSNRWLGVLVAIAGAALFHLAVFGERGDLVGGWTLTWEGVYIGFVRLLFPFFAGVLMMRLGMRIRVKGAFWTSSLLLIVALSLPRFGGTANLWMNGLYEALCVLVIFPLVVDSADVTVLPAVSVTKAWIEYVVPLVKLASVAVYGADDDADVPFVVHVAPPSLLTWITTLEIAAVGAFVPVYDVSAAAERLNAGVSVPMIPSLDNKPSSVVVIVSVPAVGAVVSTVIRPFVV